VAVIAASAIGALVAVRARRSGHGNAAVEVAVIDLPAGRTGRLVLSGAGARRSISAGLTNLPAGRYVLTASPVHVGSDRYLPTLASQPILLESGHASRVTVDYADILPSTTMVLTPEVLAEASNVSPGATSGPGQIVFPAAAKLDHPVAPGDVLAAGITARSPLGLLVRVVSVHHSQGATTLDTVPAALTDALRRARLSVRDVVSLADGSPTSQWSTLSEASLPVTRRMADGAGRTLAYQLASASVRSTLPPLRFSWKGTNSWEHKGCKPFGSSSGKTNAGSAPAGSGVGSAPGSGASTGAASTTSTTTGGKSSAGSSLEGSTKANVSASFALDLQPAIALDASWGFLGRGLTARFAVSLSQSAAAALQADAEYECSYTASRPAQPKLVGTPFVVDIGIPVVVVPGLQWKYGLSGKLSGGLDLAATEQSDWTVGVRLAQGRLHPFHSATASLHVEKAKLDLATELKFFVGPELTYSIDGQAGPFANPDGYLKGVVSNDAAKAGAWLGIEANVGLHLGIFGLKEKDYGVTLPIWTARVWAPGHSGSTKSPTTKSPTTNFSALVGHYYGSTGGSGDAVIGPDGSGQFTVPDLTACPSCSDATAPQAIITFRVTSITAPGDPGTYVVRAVITAESDPANAMSIGAGAVGSSLTAFLVPPGILTLSFLPSNDHLCRPNVCNPSSTSTSAPPPASAAPIPVHGAAPGNGTPAEAVAGFLDALLVAQDAGKACGYVLPDEQANCAAGLAGQGDLGNTGHIVLTATVVNGAQALVASTGQLCGPVAGGACIANSDARFGLPSSGESFSSAFAAALSTSGARGWGAFACEQVNGLWYLNIGS